MVFNSNIESRANLKPSEEIETQKVALKELADWITKTCIPNLVSEFLSDQSGRLADSKSIAEMFHQHGVNMRYLG
jgi:hypothetical protein